MNVTLRFFVLAASVSGVLGACVSPDDPPITGGPNGINNPPCESIAGTWALESGTCKIAANCTITQNGCTGSFTCDDGSISNSLTVSGSTVSFTVDVASGTATCTGTILNGSLSGSCDTPADSCGFSATQNGVVGPGSGGASNGGGSDVGGRGNGGGSDVGGRGSGGLIGSGGFGTGGFANPGVCPVAFPVQACNDCLANQCNNACGACGGDAQCTTALACIYNCSTSGGTCTDCTTGLTDSNSITLFTDFANCFTGTCFNECGGSTTTSGQIGDVCTADTDCTAANANAQCTGTLDSPGFCSLICVSDIDCGTNSQGMLNYCVLNTLNNYQCFPGCSTDSDCLNFPGATCQVTPDGTKYICST